MKICGITRERDLESAVQLGADALGFVYGYKGSPRNLKFEQLKRLVAAVPPYVSSVVVTPAQNPELIDIVRIVRPAYIQLEADNDISEKLSTKTGFDSIIQTFHVEDDAKAVDLIAKCRALRSSSKAVLLDSKSREDESMAGGTGVPHDWSLSRKIRDALYPRPIILAGGLKKYNVARAIKLVEPYAVDVSSGVEIKPGVKDKKELEEFIRLAKAS